MTKFALAAAAAAGFFWWAAGFVPAYTLSLSFWAVPVLLMTVFLHRKGLMSPEVRKALWISLSVIAVLGSGLDLVFARYFFTFENKAAVLGITIRRIPVEEFAFYVLGGWFLSLSYVFCDEYWLSRYNRPDHEYRRWARRLPRMVLPSPEGWGLAVSAAVAGIAYKRWANPEGMPVPGYFLFLLVLAYLPFFLLRRTVGRFVNWRGYAMTLSVTLGISLLWEATLAVPGKWWGYQDGAMLGIFVKPWSGLPIEAVTVWFFCSIAVFLYEAAKIWLHRRGARP